MTGLRIPLAVLDLSPIRAGGTAGQALRESIDLAQRCEAAGYARYWVAEHHFAPGVACSSPTILIGQIAAATSSIRVGSGAVQTGHQTPVSIVEQFGVLAALFPGRIDLGLGRSGQKRAEVSAKEASTPTAPRPRRPRPPAHHVDGLLIPEPVSLGHLFRSPRLGALFGALQQPGAGPVDYAEQVAEIAALIDGTLESPDGFSIQAFPGEGADVELWIFGSSRGQSAQVAGARGLPFVANYHVSPATVLEAVEAYRAAFRPSAVLAEPHVAVSADVVVADTDERAQELAAPYALWVLSVRTGLDAMPYPTEEDAAAHEWTDEERTLVLDRTSTQFVGSPATVVEGLGTLVRATGADEVVITSVTHDHADRVRSHELLAKAWRSRAATS